MKFLRKAGVMLLAAALLLVTFPAAAFAGTGDGAPANRGYGSGSSDGVKFYDVSYTQPGTVDFVILPYGEAQPSAVQVKNHQDASGASVAADYYGAREATGAGEQYDAVLLSSNEAPYINLAVGKYCVYTVCTDEDGTSGVTYCNFDSLPYSIEIKETLTITVNDGTNPIEGASVKVGFQTKTTNASGQAIFTLSGGTYTYLVQKSGYTGVSGSYTANKQTDTKTVSLTSGSGGDYSAVLNVKDDKGTNLKNAKVTIGSNIKTADADGNVEFFLTQGVYSYTVSALGRITKTGSITVTGDNISGNVVLDTDPDGVDLVVEDHQKGKLGNEISDILNANCLSTEVVASLTVHDGVMDSSDFSYSSGGMEKLWSDTNILTSVDLSDTTLYNNLLPESAFRGASHLSSITLPNTVTDIGAYAFAYCPLTAFTFPNSVKVIGDSVFEYCPSLKSVTIPSSVTSLGNYLFSASYGSGLAPIEDVYMSTADPASVTVSRTSFFNNSDAVLHVDKKLINVYKSDSRDGSTTDARWYGLWIDDPDAVPVINGESAGWYDDSNVYFYFRSDSLGQYYYAVVDDGDPAPTINTTGTGTALTNLQGQTIFAGPTAAKDIYIVLKGRNGKFSNVLKMDIPVAGTASIDVTVTGHTAGDIWDEINVKLAQANLSYNYNNVGSLTVDGGTINGDDAGYISYLYLTSADFSGTSFADGKIPDGLLGSSENLTTLLLPDAVTAIGQYAFYGMKSLKSVTLGSTVPPTLGEGAFVSSWDDDDNPVYDHTGAVIYVPSGSVSAYQNAVDNDATDGKWYGFSVQPTPDFVAVTGITGVPTTATAGTVLTLTGTVAPSNATNKTISWSVQNAGGTHATITGNKLSTTAAGTVTVTATVAKGKSASTPYTHDFTITITDASTIPTVSTGAASGVTSSGATLNGNVTASGGVTVTERGFVYGKSANPAIGGSGVTKVTSGTGTGSFTYTLSGLLASTTYHVRAYAINSKGTSYGSDITFTTPFDGKLKTPDMTAVSSGYNSIRLSWGAVSGANGYIIYRAASSGGTYSKVGTITNASTVTWTSTGLTAGTTYYYKMRAYRNIGSSTLFSGYSAVKSAKPLPAAPASVKAEQASYNSIKITWGKVAGATKYEVYRATSSTGKYKLLTATGSASYTNKGVNTGTTYYYKVRAVKGTKVYGPYSKVISGKTTLSIPAYVKAVRASSTSIKVSWKAVAGATKYEIWSAAKADGTYSLTATTPKTSFTNTKLTTGKTYYYKVRAYRLVGSTKVYGLFGASVYAKP